MVKLIEPDGIENIIVTQEYAIKYCKEHLGWSWGLIENDEIYDKEW